MSPSVEYLVTHSIPEIGVQINDVIVVQKTRMMLLRKVEGKYSAWELPLTGMFILLQRWHHLRWFASVDAPNLLFENEVPEIAPELAVSTNESPKRQRGRPRTRRPAVEVVR